jgi:hypothetical protein
VQNKRFCDNIPLYELYHIQTYLYITNILYCDVVECIRSAEQNTNDQSDNIDIKITSITRDLVLWNKIIIPKIKQFYRLMHYIFSHVDEYINGNKTIIIDNYIK